MTNKLICIRWAFDLQQWKPSTQELLLATSSIQVEEKERLINFHFREDFDSSLIGRLLIRKFIKTVTNIPYEKINLKRDAYGKPFLTNKLGENNHISFNVSHQGRFSVLAGIFQSKLISSLNRNESDWVDLGVDVMKIEYTGGKGLSEFFRIMNRNFAQDEWQFIRKHSNELDQLKTFMRFWCLKESYVKNLGVGVTVNLRNICFNIKSENLHENNILTDTEIKVNSSLLPIWIFEEHMLDNKHFATIAFKNWNNNIGVGSFNFLNCKDLLEDCVEFVDKDEIYCQKVIDKEYKKL